MAKLGSQAEGVMHILDTPETNRLQNVRTKAISHSHLIRQICPLLIPVSDKEIEDLNEASRETLDKDLKDEGSILNWIHSEVGLVYNFKP
jgi:hypothetical protein